MSQFEMKEGLDGHKIFCSERCRGDEEPHATDAKKPEEPPNTLNTCAECGARLTTSMFWNVSGKFFCSERCRRDVETNEEPAPAHDPVNRPSHYTSHPSGVECITITRHHNFNIGNVIKYCWRAGLKGGAPNVEDLKKAQWYLADEIRRLEK